MVLLLAACTCVVSVWRGNAAVVKSTEQSIVIPTYLAGDPEPNPMFYFGRGSQGAEGRVYPYPLYDTLTNIRSNKAYRIVYLENEYVRVGILPEIGGRLFEAVDKSNGYDFIYRQHVIKPALIGLIGAWISGGIEWNIPHHHRATTFLPVQYRVETNRDGSKTVWVGELEVRHRMRWAVGYTLHPAKSYLECSVRIVNRTPVANTMLCFANVAVHVNEHYQVIYPPGTRHVTFHGKREFASWPIATTRYAGADFTRGVDVSWYSNHVSANSMFAWNYEDDFFAGYDHGRQAGIMSFADHHSVPGKKFWTWGNGPRGRMWDKILTDDDGPYIELMVGAYSDNQPDYSWVQPYETKSFEMYWYPFREIGGVKKANLDAAVNLEARTNGVARLGVCTTSAHRGATVSLLLAGKVLLEKKIAIDPARPFVTEVTLPAGYDEQQLLAVLAADGKELIRYSPARLEPEKTPEPVNGPATPKEIMTIEELYLAGQRIEQFHDPNREPEPYWEEALSRDPADARVNTALGIRKLNQARFDAAERHFRTAIDRLSFNYTAPKDGEAYYYLGLALQAQAWCSSDTAKLTEAFTSFAKAAWSEAWRSPAYLGMAEIATSRKDFSAALGHVNSSLQANALNLGALNLRSALLRHTGRGREALGLLKLASRATDPLDVRLMSERWLAGEKPALNELRATLSRHPATGLEAVVEYGLAGLWQDGADLLDLMLETCSCGCASSCASPLPATGRVAPLACYLRAYYSERNGEAAKAAEYRRRAIGLSPEYVFPFEWELIPVLQQAMRVNSQDARARYYLGNLLFDWEPEAAVKLWEAAAALDPAFPLVQRNLAMAYSHAKPVPDRVRAIAALERATAAPKKYALHFAELDELSADAGTDPAKRLAFLEQNHAVVAKRDDALAREIGLKVFAGKYDQAIELMTGRKFSVWEGGTLEVADHWVDAHLLRGRQRLASGQYAAALTDFKGAESIPANLPTEREVGREAEIAYWIAAAQEALGNRVEAKRSWERSTSIATGQGRRGEGRLSEGLVQNYYRGLAQQKLERTAEAKAAFEKLIEVSRRELEKGESSGEPSNEAGRKPGSRTALAHFLAGLGHLGLGEQDKAKVEFQAALKARPDHLGARVAMQ
jgi:tetratricopeptide (TPR) repeat protein